MPDELTDENQATNEAEFDYKKIEVEKVEEQNGETAWTLNESHWKLLEERLARIEERLAEPEPEPELEPEPEMEPEPELEPEPPQLIVKENPQAGNVKQKNSRRRYLKWPKLKRR